MSSKSKLRYVPRHQRGRQTKDRRPERLHGAFTGGFSAGHFNTVATPEGWKPKEDVKTEGQGGEQNLEDFMDEQDHNEWGGPQSVRQDLVGQSLTAEPASVQTATLLTESIFGGKELTPSNVGSRLLKKMGWRQGSSTAIVPSDETRVSSMKEDEEWQYLSERRLKKIKVQQDSIRIPRPKLDQVGLGFDAHANAPEFQKFREKRRRLAQERARGNHRSVYRLTNVLDNEEVVDGSSSRRGNLPQDDDREHNYESYEVLEDFVGSRTVGGFALHDDEDDAFDDTTKALTNMSDKILLDKDEYNTVIEDPQSDDDNINDDQMGQANDLAKGLLAWTDTATHPENTAWDGEPNTTVMTSDGRPPLSGFVLGGSGGGLLQRFRGPDIPDDYEVTPHAFREDEHPLVWKTLARAVQLENDQARREASVKDALASGRVQKRAAPQQPDVSAPLAGAAFSSLAIAMKSKFTTGSAPAAQENDKLGLSAGLVHASDLHKIRPSTESTNNDSRRILPVTRTAQSFTPTPLLCKRFGVRNPSLTSTALVTQKETPASAEESFFRNEVLPALDRANAKSDADSPSRMREDDGASTQHVYLDRPSMDVYRSIFGAEDSENDNDDDSEKIRDQNRTPGKNASPLAEDRSKEEERRIRVPDVDSTLPSDMHGHEEQRKRWSSDSSGEPSSDESRKRSTKEHRKRKKKDRKKKKHRKRDRSNDDESDTSDRERKRKRRHHKRKEDKKKRDKSKHRKDEKESE
eukprot:scaffold1117_cov167-Amphora_coffeaeformis.AAC.7